MKKRLKINGIIIFASFLLILIFPALFFRKDRIVGIDEFVELFGFALVLLGQIIRVSARGYKSEHSKEGAFLIQDGPYAHVRNPMYLGILLIGIGIVFMLFQWWVVAVFILIFIFRYILLILSEEKKLLSIFGRVYSDYMQKVPRLMPSVKKLLKANIAVYLPIKLKWFYKEIGSISAVLILVLCLESWSDLKNEGVKIYSRELIWLIIIFLCFLKFVIYLSRKTERLENAASKS